MAKALVINGADFSTNKITKLTFGSIPCTGIELDESSISASDYDPITLGYTVTPANTTDGIIWTSSDENVASVAAGVVNPVGIGNCTITATCGNFSDSVEVSVNIAYIQSYSFGQISSNGTSPNEFLSITESYNRIAVVGDGNQAGTYKCYGKNGHSDENIIKLPKNTVSVTVKNTNRGLVHDGLYTRMYFLADESCEAVGFTDCARLISQENLNFNTTQEKTFTVPDGADACMFVVRTPTTYTSEDDPATIMQNMGFSLTFNAVS